MKHARGLAVALILAIGVAPKATAELRLPHTIADHMVVQQGRPFPVHGWADAGSAVHVSFAGATANARAGADGAWRVVLPAPRASADARALVIAAGGERREIVDVLVGEVWLCAGQSNMVWRMNATEDFETFRADAERPTIRMFTAALVASETPRDDVDGAWVVCTPETVGKFSGAAYHFGRCLSEALDVPIGLMNVSWGGSRAEAWIGPERLASVAPGREAIAQWRAYRDAFDRDPAAYASPSVDDSDWLDGHVPGRFAAFGIPDADDGLFWQRQTVAIPERWAGRDLVLSLAMIDDDDVTYFNGVEVGRTSGWQTPRRYTVPGGLVATGPATLAVRITDGAGPGGVHGEADALFVHPVDAPDDRVSLAGAARLVHVSSARGLPSQHRPSQLHHGMLNPVRDTAYAGVIWYQGENNAIGPGSAAGYADLLPLLIEDWRDFLGSADLPFLIVQLANLAHADNGDWDFPLVRDIQRRVHQGTPHTGLAVTIDIGNARDIHPRNKRDVGDRLARWALDDTYGIEMGVKSGPLPLAAAKRGADVVVTFDTFRSRLAVRDGDISTTVVHGFEVANADGRFVPADAHISGAATVTVLRPAGLDTVSSVRYAWQPDPAAADLIEVDGLPASPFDLEVDADP